MVPSSAIRYEENGEIAKIFIINGRRAIEKKVTVLIDSGEEAIIKSGEGYKIILYDEIARNAKEISEDKIIISN